MNSNYVKFDYIPITFSQRYVTHNESEPVRRSSSISSADNRESNKDKDVIQMVMKLALPLWSFHFKTAPKISKLIFGICKSSVVTN